MLPTLQCADVECARVSTTPPLQGPKAFYKGATARLARVCLDVTVIMVLYEQLNKVLDSVWPDPK